MLSCALCMCMIDLLYQIAPFSNQCLNCHASNRTHKQARYWNKHIYFGHTPLSASIRTLNPLSCICFLGRWSLRTAIITLSTILHAPVKTQCECISLSLTINTHMLRCAYWILCKHTETPSSNRIDKATTLASHKNTKTQPSTALHSQCNMYPTTTSKDIRRNPYLARTHATNETWFLFFIKLPLLGMICYGWSEYKDGWMDGCMVGWPGGEVGVFAGAAAKRCDK